MSIASNIENFISEIPNHVTLVAVSKTKPVEDILEAYQTGQKVFGENKVQDLVTKFEDERLPKDIQWHFIGHLQRNKVKYIAPFVSLIHGVDNLKLLAEINKRAAQNNRKIDCLIQVHIANEDSKFGFSIEEANELFRNNILKEFEHINCIGLMGMATNTDVADVIKQEFSELQTLFNSVATLTTLSMGMSGDYKIAIENGSNMIRVGSSIFGKRNY